MKTQTPLNHKPPVSGRAPAAQPGKIKLWAFRLLAVLVLPALLTALLECVLRIAGFGYPTGAIIKRDIGGKEVYCHNNKFGWRFFPRTAARTFDGFVFDAEKPPHTYRIFILGESAAMGMPAPAYNFGRILEAMLHDKYPGLTFEVHTAAMVAINSHAIREIAADCAEHDSDLFILYMGNNEVVGPFGPGTVFAPLSPSLTMIRANLAAKSTRTGQLIEQLLSVALPQGKTPQRWGGLEMFLDKQVRHDSPALNAVYRRFEANLRDICRIARKSGAAVIVSNAGCNLKDSPPFASLHRDGLDAVQLQSWQQFYREGITFEADGQYRQAIERYAAAAEIDDTFADLQFRLGRCHWNLEDYIEAKHYYIKALHYDTLRFRADSRINEILRSVAERREHEGLYFVDSIAALEANSPHATPGAELFYEHVHFNFTGNYVLAAAVLPAIEKSMSPALTPPPGRLLTEAQSAGRLAYTDFERRDFLTRIFKKMLSEPPFTNQLYHDERMSSVDLQLQQLNASLDPAGLNACRKQYTQTLQTNPDDWHVRWQYALFLGNGLKDLREQETQLRKVIQLCPYDSAYLSLGKNLRRQGKLNEARQILDDLLKLNAHDGNAHAELASIYQQLRNTGKVIEHLWAALAIDPASSIEAYGVLALAFEQAGQPDKAIRTLRRAVGLFPESQTAPAHASLGYMLNTRGEYREALKELRIALKINPDFAHDELFTSLMKQLESRGNP